LLDKRERDRSNSHEDKDNRSDQQAAEDSCPAPLMRLPLLGFRGSVLRGFLGSAFLVELCVLLGIGVASSPIQDRSCERVVRDLITDAVGRLAGCNGANDLELVEPA